MQRDAIRSSLLSISLLLLAQLLAAGRSPAAQPVIPEPSPKVGEAAPSIEPAEWLNAKGPVTWDSFKDRLVLMDMWATWCGPCMRSIPELIKLHEAYEKKGLTVIGHSVNEDAATVKPIVEKMKMSYLVAIGGTTGYKSGTIPHAWLVSGGKVVWTGNPLTSLTPAVIEEHLKGLKPKTVEPPEIKLPKELEAAQKSFDAGKYGAAIKELERRLKGRKKDDVAKMGAAALEKIQKYGADKYSEAVSLKKEKDYGPAVRILAGLEKSFAGDDLGDKAKTRRTEWLKDKAIAAEVKGWAELEKARDLAAKEKYKEAKGILKGLAEGKKYAGTKLADHAKEEMEKIKDKG
jgi:thiol-disulfide isomerase/thioredoxin